MEGKENFVESEHGYYHIDVTWKDGEHTVSNFPKAGFEVFEVDEKGNTGERLDFIKGKDAKKFLEEHAHEYLREEFSWKSFLERKKKDAEAKKDSEEPDIVKMAK